MKIIKNRIRVKYIKQLNKNNVVKNVNSLKFNLLAQVKKFEHLFFMSEGKVKLEMDRLLQHHEAVVSDRWGEERSTLHLWS